MRKILDTLLNKKIMVIMPLVITVLIYILFLIFGNDPNKVNLLITMTIISLMFFWGVYLVIYIQIKNPSCPEWFLNLFEFLALVIFGFGGAFSAVNFFIHINDGFTPMTCCLGMVALSSISYVHGKRK